MDETIMNAEQPEVVQPENDSAKAAEQQTEAVAKPRDIENMSDDEFAKYLQEVQDGTIQNIAETTSTQSDDGNIGDSDDETGDTDPQEEEAKEIKPYKVYNTHEEFQQDFDRVMGERLKKNRESLDLFDKVKIQARNFYGDAADDMAAVEALIGDLTNQNADRRGVETEEYNRQTQDAEDARRWRERQQAQITQQQQQNAKNEQLRRDIEDVRRVVPSFDFRKAMENETFRKAIMDGASVQTAYMIANKPNPTTKRQPIRQVAMQSGVSGQSDYDPSKLPSDEFRAYIDKQMNR